jgi:hypothetical protein
MATVDGVVAFLDRFDLADAGDRRAAAAALRARFPADYPEGAAAELDAELLRLAAPGPEAADRAESQAQTLLRLAESAGAELFRATDGKAFATVPVADGRRDTFPLRSRRFRSWLTRLFFRERGGPPAAEAFQGALSVLEAMAEFEGEEHPVHVRVAGDDDVIYLDLADDTRRAVEVTDRGWEVVDRVPPKFRRAGGMRPLPEPVRGGELEGLRTFVNLPPREGGDDSDWRLFLAWLTMTLRPRGPYPILNVQGVLGSAKTTTCEVARALVDPHVTPLRSPPREVRDLMIAATAAWVVAYDNLSHLPDWLSDDLCRLASGGGFATRALFTDDDEINFEAQRPVVINGIEQVADRADLLDRCVIVRLGAIAEADRTAERAFWAAFEAARPKLLGALLDAVAGGLRELPAVRLEALPRMADFAVWGEAVGRALGWGEGVFLAAYAGNRKDAVAFAVAGSPVADAILRLAQDKAGAEGDGRDESEPVWEGTSTELHDALTAAVGEVVARQKTWPKSPHALSRQLPRHVTPLAALGVDLTFGTVGKGKDRRNRISIFYRTPDDDAGSGAIAAGSGAIATGPMQKRQTEPPNRNTVQGNDLGNGDPPQSGATGASGAISPPLDRGVVVCADGRERIEL